MFAFLVLLVWAIWAIVDGRFLSGSIGLLLVATVIGFIWNWFLPNVFLVNVGHASFFTLIWVTAFIVLIISVIPYIMD